MIFFDLVDKVYKLYIDLSFLNEAAELRGGEVILCKALFYMHLPMQNRVNYGLFLSFHK
jgi:hypothetical protein